MSNLSLFESLLGVAFAICTALFVHEGKPAWAVWCALMVLLQGFKLVAQAMRERK